MTVLQILSTLSFLCFVQAENYISTTEADKGNASSICHLATPAIFYSENGSTVDLNITIEDGQKLWVGYALTTFISIDCSKPQEMHAETTINTDPGQCFSFCKSSFVGMQENKCYCFNSKPKDIGSGRCDLNKCDITPKTLCGENENGVSVYMSVKDTNKGKSNGKNCQAVHWSSAATHFTWNYVWADCNTECKTICQKDLSPMVQQGYIEGKDGQVYVKFETSETSNLKLRALCTRESELIVPSSTLATKTESEETEPISGQSTPQQSSSTSTTEENPMDETFTKGQTTPQQPSSTSTTEENPQDKSLTKTSGGDNSSLVAVVVVITILVLIALVVGVFLIWRRRKHSLVKKDDSALSQEIDHSNPRSRNALSNESYLDGDIRHDYFTLEPVNEYAEIKDVDVTATTDDEYDTTTNLPKKDNATSNDTDNVYNKLEDLTDETYNHTNTAAAIAVETYDKATSNDQKSTYNTADALPGSGIANDKVTDSEYNTLDSIGGT